MDEGLRSYMLGVYNYMAAGVALTGLVAYGLFNALTTTDSSQAAAQLKNGIMLTEMGKMLYTSPLMWVVALAPLAFIFIIGFRAHKMSVSGAQTAFWAFAAVMGLSLSSIFLRYTGA
ncbi:MAG: Bax inhibitor-1 family protein, partial [Hyphomicrobiaceae bacterium]